MVNGLESSICKLSELAETETAQKIRMNKLVKNPFK